MDLFWPVYAFWSERDRLNDRSEKAYFMDLPLTDLENDDGCSVLLKIRISQQYRRDFLPNAEMPNCYPPRQEERQK